MCVCSAVINKVHKLLCSKDSNLMVTNNRGWAYTSELPYLMEHKGREISLIQPDHMYVLKQTVIWL